jgi:hypothetical protein
MQELLIDLEIAIETAKTLSEEAIGLCIDCLAVKKATKSQLTKLLNIRASLATNKNLNLVNADKAIESLIITIKMYSDLLAAK